MKISWTAEKIKEGFERFLVEQGRLPLSQEIDGIDYLPSKKLIERNFGGLEKLRAELGYKDTPICNCLKGRCKTSGGYVWKYAN
jgi:hypothetical protein